MRYAILMLMLISAPCWAVPTGTVTRSVMTDSNGVLIGWASNLVPANGIATTAQLAEVSGDLGAISNLAASAFSTGISAQATADAAMATGMAAIAALGGYATAGELTVISNMAASSMATGVAAQASAGSAMATGVAAHAIASQAQGWIASFTNTMFVMITSHTHSAHGVTTNGGFRGGTNASATLGGAIGSAATSTTGGAIGQLTSTSSGGGVGYRARSTFGGAVGENALTTSGGAIGSSANATNGGAVGFSAKTFNGGAIGYSAKSGNGFAAGNQAYATTDGTDQGTGIDAIQLGSGGNTNAGTLQVYTYQLMSANGRIPFARLSFQGCPTSDVNLVSGDVWSSNGILRVVQ